VLLDILLLKWLDMLQDAVNANIGAWERLEAPVSPIPATGNCSKAQQSVNQDKIAARKAVLDRKAAAKSAAQEAPAAEDTFQSQGGDSSQKSPQLDKGERELQKREQAAAKKAAKEAEKLAKEAEKAEKARQKQAEKMAKAAQKEQAKAAKAAESKARGTNADQEVTVLLDTSISSKGKKAIIDAFDAHEIKFNYEVGPGRLSGWSTITWKRCNSALV
jgi:hypothetical protein